MDYLPWAQANLKVTKVGETYIDAHCPLHDDAHPSFSISRRTGRWRCFGCSTKGRINDLCLLLKLPTFSDRPSAACEPLPEIFSIDVRRYNEFLLSNVLIKARLAKEWGIDPITIVKYSLGYDDVEQRLWIPIYFDKHLVNVRRYRFDAHTAKVLSVKGVKKVYPFPFENIDYPDIVLCEGEKDAIVANFHGIRAITFTGGASTIPEDDIIELFREKQVYICYDCDKAGEQGTIKVINALKGIVSRVYVIALPVGELGKGGDITDYFQKNYTKKDFDGLIALAQQRWPVLKVEKDLDDKIYDTTISNSRQPGFFDKRVKCTAMCVGKALQPYTVPYRGVANCSNRSKDVCAMCKINELPQNSTEGITIQIPDMECGEVLGLIKTPDTKQAKVASRLFGFMCDEWVWVTEEHQNVEQLLLSNDPLTGSDTDEPVTHTAYYVGILPIGENLTYELTGRQVADPMTQEVTHINTVAITAHGFLRAGCTSEPWPEMLEAMDC